MSERWFGPHDAGGKAEDLFESGVGQEEIATRIRAFIETVRVSKDSRVSSPMLDSTQDRKEARRLASVMVSDFQIYRPKQHKRPVGDGAFLETLASWLIRGKEIVHERFGHLPDRT